MFAEVDELSGDSLDSFDVGVEEDIDVRGLVFDDACDELFEGQTVLQRVVFFLEVELETHELCRTERKLDELGVEHAFEDREVVVVEVRTDVLVDVWSQVITHQRVLHYECLRGDLKVAFINGVEFLGDLRHLWLSKTTVMSGFASRSTVKSTGLFQIVG